MKKLKKIIESKGIGLLLLIPSKDLYFSELTGLSKPGYKSFQGATLLSDYRLDAFDCEAFLISNCVVSFHFYSRDVIIW